MRLGGRWLGVVAERNRSALALACRSQLRSVLRSQKSSRYRFAAASVGRTDLRYRRDTSWNSASPSSRPGRPLAGSSIRARLPPPAEHISRAPPLPAGFQSLRDHPLDDALNANALGGLRHGEGRSADRNLGPRELQNLLHLRAVATAARAKYLSRRCEPVRTCGQPRLLRRVHGRCLPVLQPQRRVTS